MFVEASIIIDSSNRMSLPTDAIGVVDDQSYVFLLDETKDKTYFFKQVPVKTQGSYKNSTTFDASSNFEKGTQFLTKGAFSLIGESVE